MAGAPQREPPRMSIELFRAFYATRPDEEHWQLIDGVAIMMTPPTVAHQCIATNLQLLLHTALETHAPTLSALQRLGVDARQAFEVGDTPYDAIAAAHAGLVGSIGVLTGGFPPQSLPSAGCSVVLEEARQLAAALQARRLSLR